LNGERLPVAILRPLEVSGHVRPSASRPQTRALLGVLVLYAAKVVSPTFGKARSEKPFGAPPHCGPSLPAALRLGAQLLQPVAPSATAGRCRRAHRRRRFEALLSQRRTGMGERIPRGGRSCSKCRFRCGVDRPGEFAEEPFADAEPARLEELWLGRREGALRGPLAPAPPPAQAAPGPEHPRRWRR
jgi:hypothetical protein